MFLTIKKEDVIEGLQKAAGIIPQKIGAAYLRSLWLKAENGNLQILTTDSNLEFHGNYHAEIKKDGFIGVQGKSFVELIRKLPNGDINISLDDNSETILIEQGRRKYKLPTNDITWFQSFSSFPEENPVIWSGDFLQELIDKIIYCVGEEGMDAVSCMIIKPSVNHSIEAAGMNGHQFAMVSFVHDELRDILPEEGILIQKKYLQELKKWLGLQEIEVSINDKRLFLRTIDKKESFSLPLSLFKYPDYNAFLSRLADDNVSKLMLDKSEAQDSLQRINIFNTESNRCTYFELKETEAILTVSGADTGSGAEIIDTSYSGNIKKIGFPTNNLLTILDHYNSNKIEFTLTGSEGPCGITGVDDPEYTVIIMPMKIVDETPLNEEQV